ncbi:MAG: peptidoglycan-binding protein [Deltaproteobacteria bacterium]|nr:peptidoglycan-binding protein [Deltaproteobacteria bacterium]
MKQPVHGGYGHDFGLIALMSSLSRFQGRGSAGAGGPEAAIAALVNAVAARPDRVGTSETAHLAEQATQLGNAILAMMFMRMLGIQDSFERNADRPQGPIASQARNLDVYTPYVDGPMHIGHSGPAVERLQVLLNALGANLEVDGKFGPKTEAALKSFQASANLPVTGIQDPRTLAQLERFDRPLTQQEWSRYQPDYDSDLSTVGADKRRVLDARATNIALDPNMSEKKLLDQIAAGEGTSDATARQYGYASGYDVTLGYGAYANDKQKPLTSMTVGEVKALQQKMLAHPRNRLDSSAVGRYQIVGKTLRGLQKQMGIPDSAVFTPELQDRMAMQLLETRGLSKFRSGRMSASAFQNSLAKEWASIARADTGRSSYPGQRTGTSGSAIRSLLAGL